MSKGKKPGMDACEQVFCSYLARLQNAEEAARRAGLAPGDAAGLLLRPDIREKADRLVEQEARMAEAAALAGLRRLAFGRVNDGARLAAAEPEELDLEGLDLFCVSEIRRPKGGGCEVRFHDRLEALRLLLEYGREQAVREGGTLLEALENSVPAAPPAADDRAL